MGDSSFTKIDIIIIIILALLVAFIIGFNILQIIDTKLSSVVINVPPSTCTLPPIYVNFDKDNKPIKLNSEQLNMLNNKINSTEPEKKVEKFDILDNSIDSIDSNMSVENFGDHSEYTFDSNSNSSDIQREITMDADVSEEFGNLPSDVYVGQSSQSLNEWGDNFHRDAIKISPDLGNRIVNMPNKFQEMRDPNYNTLNNMPYLVDLENPDKGYYPSRVKLVTDPKSPLLRLEEKNADKIANTLNKCVKSDQEITINKTFDGYNKYPNLKGDSYANVTSIGKNLMTPYISYPVPS
jgi:hypothetical protein